jgi:arylsulfatase A
MWTGWDVLPTLAAIAGAPHPTGTDGTSMLPALFGQRQKGHDYLYWEFHEGEYAQALRLGRWKAVRKANKATELYDLETDTGEARDLAQSHPDIVRRVEAIMKAAHRESEFWPVR